MAGPYEIADEGADDVPEVLSMCRRGGDVHTLVVIDADGVRAR